jgi:hypothetical protein
MRWTWRRRSARSLATAMDPEPTPKTVMAREELA